MKPARLAAPLLLLALMGLQWKTSLKPEYKPALEAISEASLRANLKFLSSDLLEGRGTPSRGLDIAAQFIATEFEKDGLEPGTSDGFFQKTVWPPTGEKSAPTQNVIGLLRGSDPKLKDTYLLITAHYDHLGVNLKKEGDQIYNGANDDGSGTVSVMEIAKALTKLKQRPRRSIVFMTFFGEERGLRGSHYYGEHPVFPLDKTIGQINLEQVGRVDDDGEDMTGKANMTGFTFSNLPSAVADAGKLVGLNVYNNQKLGDMFFAASDNQSLADVGIPSHTISVGFEFPDYHGVGDTWDKIDYKNMALVNKAVALAALTIANSQQTPMWDSSNPRTKKYVEAYRKLHSVG